VQLAIAAKPDAIDVGFWRAVLGYDPMSDDNGVDPLGHGSTAWMQELDPAKPLQHAMHVDVSVAHEHVEARLAAALAAGGRVVDDSGAPGGWILSDRAGKRSASPPGRMGLAALDQLWPLGATRTAHHQRGHHSGGVLTDALTSSDATGSDLYVHGIRPAHARAFRRSALPPSLKASLLGRRTGRRHAQNQGAWLPSASEPSSPILSATVAAWTRPFTPSFRRMAVTCTLAVFGLM
jgi:hypothetical protein